MINRYFIILFLGILFFSNNSFSNNLKNDTIPKKNNFSIKFGGRILADYAHFNQNIKLGSAFGKINPTNKAEFRRARLFTSGSLNKNIVFKISVDFAEGNFDVKDLFIGYKNIPAIGTLRIGHIKEPFRLDVLNSSKYINFNERSFAIDFMKVRNYGILFFNDYLDKKISLQLGYFINDNNPSKDKTIKGGSALTSRITGLIINNKKELLQIGTSYSYRTSNSKEFKITSSPEVNLSPIDYIKTEVIKNVNHTSLYNFEAVYNINSISLQSELLLSKVNTNLNNYFFKTFYSEISYFITGEQKTYRSSYAGFGKITPKSKFNFKNGTGAFQVVARYSSSNLNSKDILGGQQKNYTLGLNWYPNSLTRFSLNNVWANVINQGKASILSARFQLEF